MKNNNSLIIIVTAALLGVMGVGYVSLQAQQQTGFAVLGDQISAVAAKVAAMPVGPVTAIPAKTAPVVSCAYINEGYGFLATKSWTISNGLWSIDISKWLPKAVTGSEMTRGVAATRSTDPRTIFFSTRLGDGQELTSRIYSFNLDTHNLVKVFESTFKDGTILHVRGFDGNKLVILREGVDNSPGPCAPEWGTVGYFSLDIAVSGASLAAYQVPQCLVDLAVAKGQACADEISAAENSAYGDNPDGGTAR